MCVVIVPGTLNCFVSLRVKNSATRRKRGASSGARSGLLPLPNTRQLSKVMLWNGFGSILMGALFVKSFLGLQDSAIGRDPRLQGKMRVPNFSPRKYGPFEQYSRGPFQQRLLWDDMTVPENYEENNGPLDMCAAIRLSCRQCGRPPGACIVELAKGDDFWPFQFQQNVLPAVPWQIAQSPKQPPSARIQVLAATSLQ